MKIIFKLILPLILATGFVSPSYPASTGIGGNSEWGNPSDGVQLSLSTSDPNASELQVAFRNVGNRDVMLNLGGMMANGKVQLPQGISIEFTDGQGKVRLFKFADKKHSSVGGRLDDYIVPLRVDSMYTLSVTLDQFWCPETNEFKIPLTAGKNHLTAQFRGTGAHFINLDTPGIRLMNFWLGNVESNTVTIER